MTIQEPSGFAYFGKTLAQFVPIRKQEWKGFEDRLCGLGGLLGAPLQMEDQAGNGFVEGQAQVSPYGLRNIGKSIELIVQPVPISLEMKFDYPAQFRHPSRIGIKTS